jgi:moderate conductance mechanosensitive channel
MPWKPEPELLWSVAAIFAVTLVLWLLLSGAAKRARNRFVALLEAASSSEESQHEAEVASRRITALRLVVSAGRYALVIAALLMVLRRLNVPLDSLLLPAGFLGAALGLGAQNLVRDIVAGLFIVFEGQLAVGDTVRIGGTIGRVEQIGLRITTLRDESGHLFFLPNGTIATVEKFPRRRTLQLSVPLPASFDGENTHIYQEIEEFLQRFNTDYAAFDNIARDASTQYSCGWRLETRPSRVTLVREKLPARLEKFMESQDAKIPPGSEIVLRDV